MVLAHDLLLHEDRVVLIERVELAAEPLLERAQRRRHDLRQPHGATVAYRVRVEPGLLLHLRQQQARRRTDLLLGGSDCLTKRLAGRAGGAGRRTAGARRLACSDAVAGRVVDLLLSGNARVDLALLVLQPGDLLAEQRLLLASLLEDVGVDQVQLRLELLAAAHLLGVLLRRDDASPQAVPQAPFRGHHFELATQIRGAPLQAGHIELLLDAPAPIVGPLLRDLLQDVDACLLPAASQIQDALAHVVHVGNELVRDIGLDVIQQRLAVARDRTGRLLLAVLRAELSQQLA